MKDKIIQVMLGEQEQGYPIYGLTKKGVLFELIRQASYESVRQKDGNYGARFIKNVYSWKYVADSPNVIDQVNKLTKTK